MTQVLNNTTASRPERPVKVLQFGEGNFLRAFADWILDLSNEEGITDLSVAIVKPRDGKSGVIDTLNRQDCFYHVCLEGIEDSLPKRTNRLISVVSDAFVPSQTEKYERYILSPDLRFIISNTTESGIRYDKDDITSPLPATFPGKIAGLLWRRFRHFNGDPSKGIFFLPCELIEDNGKKLKEYVVRHAKEASLGEDFINWIETACVFADTLVDRIVSGKPDNPAELQQELGFSDEAIVKGELYHTWVIGGEDADRIRKELPLDRSSLHVQFMKSVKGFRDRKVRILNGSHTGMVAMSLLLGCETVKDAFTNPLVNRFMSEMMENEILPVIDGDKDELKSFADGILERFYNPYIRHRLASIALNSLSKWEARNFDTVSDVMKQEGRLADYGLFTFAALLCLYSPSSGFTPEDNPEHVDFIRSNWNDDDLESTVRKIVSPESGIFLRDFEAEVPGFSSRVAEYVKDIEENGIEKALNNYFER